MKYLTSFICEGICDGAKSLPEMVAKLQAAAAELLAMHQAGVTLDTDSAYAGPDGKVTGDHAILAIEDPEVAAEFDMAASDDEEEDESTEVDA